MEIPEIGSVETVVVTKVLPFGVLVDSATGMPGLVAGATATAGDSLSVRVTAFDAEQQRFSAALV